MEKKKQIFSAISTRSNVINQYIYPIDRIKNKLEEEDRLINRETKEHTDKVIQITDGNIEAINIFPLESHFRYL